MAMMVSGEQVQASSSNDSDGDGEEPTCPLCCDEMDVYDRHFRPCACGYQICGFCYHHLKEVAEKEGSSAKCPACRSEYDETAFSYEPPSSEELERAERKRREKRRAAQQQQQQPQPLLFQAGAKQPHAPPQQQQQQQRSKDGATLPQHQQAAGPRIVQKTSVYVTGLPQSVCQEDVLRRDDFFGRYGRIRCLSVSRNGAAQVIFTSQDEASRCINALDGFPFEGKTMRAYHGTNRYCPAFVRGAQCRDAKCTYVHDAQENDSSQRQSSVPSQTSSREDEHSGRQTGAAASSQSTWSSRTSPLDAMSVNGTNGSDELGSKQEGANEASASRQQPPALQQSNGGIVPPPPPPPPAAPQHQQQQPPLPPQTPQKQQQYAQSQQPSTLSSLHDVLAQQHNVGSGAELQQQHPQGSGNAASALSSSGFDGNGGSSRSPGAFAEQRSKQQASGSGREQQHQHNDHALQQPPFPVEILQDSVDPWAFVAERGGCGLPDIGQLTQSRFSFARMGAAAESATTSADSLFRSLMGADSSTSAAAAAPNAAGSSAPPPGFSSSVRA